MIAIIDYGAGNLRSVERALVHAGAQPRVVTSQTELRRVNGIVLPGVGAFAPALERLEAGNLGRRLVELARGGTPLLGVCLGYQLLFEWSHEVGRHEGLGLFKGEVREIAGTPRLPVIGWCPVRQVDFSPLWAGIPDASHFYFAHSYTPYGVDFVNGSAPHAPAAAAARGAVMGTQFHPEKSGEAGLQVYANFLAVCGDG